MAYRFSLNFNGTLSELSDAFKTFEFAAIRTNPTLYSSSIALIRDYPPPTQEADGFIFSVVWFDPVFGDNGERSKMYMCAKQWEFNNKTGLYGGGVFLMDSETGKPGDLVVPMDAAPSDYEELYASAQEEPRWDIAPLTWVSIDRTPYTYLNYVKTFPSLINFPGYRTLIISSMNFQAWETYILDYEKADDTLFIISALQDVVYVHTLFEAPNTKPGCFASCVLDCDEVPDCKLRSEFFGPTLERVMRRLLWQPLDTFFKVTLPSTNKQVRITFGEYFEEGDVNKTNPIPRINKTENINMESGNWFARYSLIYSYHHDKGRVELLWMRPVSSVNDRVFEALVQLIAFCIAILLFDVVLGTLEYLMLAKPLSKVSFAVVSLRKLDLQEAETRLQQVFSCFGNCEVLEVVQGLRFAIENLHEYRNYIPKLLFVEDGDSDCGNLSEPPGEQGESIAVVFTDIRSSTTLWESDPAGMKESLEIHNKLIRKLISTHRGFEVKTIGDSFMITFDNCVSAVEFSIEVQVALYETQWPGSILQECFANPVDGIWNGLRVRIGIDYGTNYSLHKNISGRYDYVGSLINRASRIEGYCKPGCICMSDVVLMESDDLICSDLAYLRCPGTTLRGYKDTVLLHMISSRKCGGDERLREIEEPLPSSENNSVCSVYGKLDIGLKKRKNGTIATVTTRIDTGSVGISRFCDTIKRIAISIDRSGGDALGLSGNTVTGGWNIQSNNSGHLQSSLLFFRITHDQGIPAYIGISSGSVYLGKTGVQTQRFIATVGDPIVVAEDLCRLAVRLNVSCLCGVSELPSLDDDYQTRLVDSWIISSVKYLIHQITYYRSVIYESSDGHGSFVRSPLPGWGWGEDYNAAFAASNGIAIKKEAGSDLFLNAVADNLINGTSFYQDLNRIG